jgi:hypothetical protein
MAFVTSNKERIDYLLRQQFGTLAPPPIPLRDGGGGDALGNYRKMQAKRAEYEAMAPAEIQTLFDRAHVAAAKNASRKAEQEELALFFHQADAVADFSYWARMANWTLDEGVALSLNKDPRVVDWESVTGIDERFVPTALARSPFAKEYRQRRELVRRALTNRDLSDPIKPELFLAWASNTFDSVPGELFDQVASRGKRIDDQNALIAERDFLKLRVTELESKLLDNSGKQLQDFDSNAADYPEELHIAYLAWSAVSSDAKATANPKAKLTAWIEANFPKLSAEAKARIATVCNWNRTGGRGKRDGT